MPAIGLRAFAAAAWISFTARVRGPFFWVLRMGRYLLRGKRERRQSVDLVEREFHPPLPDQTEFAEFIEDNITDLQGEESTNLLTIASTIQATTGINFSSAKRLQDGQTQLVYNENIEAKAGANGEMKIPKTFTLDVRIFKNGAGYALSARLKYRIHGGAVKFWYELERADRVVADAFEGYVTEIREKSGYTVLLGKA